MKPAQYALFGDPRDVGSATSFAISGKCAGTGGVYCVDRAEDLE